MKKQRGIYFTDIHFGRKSNSPTHNEDCLRFIDWLCKQAIAQKCDYVGFLGDWYENRSSLNIQTMNYSYMGAKKLNELGMPVYFCVGNHDLYQRHTRDIYSTVPFQEFENFVVIDSPTIVDDIEGGALFSPFLFHDEYPNLSEYQKIPLWAGHFEFKGFKITGYNVVMEHGPDANVFDGPDDILSGHFHKRQQQRNVTYIGNCFPMDFGDAGDNDRGAAIYDHTYKKGERITFINWDQCPKYFKVKLSDLLDDDIKFDADARVHCVVDIALSHSENNDIKKKYAEEFGLREFVTEESYGLDEALTDTQVTLSNDEPQNLDQMVVAMLGDIEVDGIDNAVLIAEYMGLNIND